MERPAAVGGGEYTALCSVAIGVFRDNYKKCRIHPGTVVHQMNFHLCTHHLRSVAWFAARRLLCVSQIVRLRRRQRGCFPGACLCKTGWASISRGSRTPSRWRGCQETGGWPLALARPPLGGRSPSVAQPSTGRQEDSDQKMDWGEISFRIPSMSWAY